jgi:hypothetical protein
VDDCFCSLLRQEMKAPTRVKTEANLIGPWIIAGGP